MIQPQVQRFEQESVIQTQIIMDDNLSHLSLGSIHSDDKEKEANAKLNEELLNVNN